MVRYPTWEKQMSQNNTAQHANKETQRTLMDLHTNLGLGSSRERHLSPLYLYL